MKKFVIFLVLFVAVTSLLLLIRFSKENTDVTRTLEQERYSRMTAEEDLQKGEYRVKRLEAELQTTQMKLSQIQEVMDKFRDENALLKADLDKAAQTGITQEGALRQRLEDALAVRSEFEAKLREAQDAARVAAQEVRQAQERAQAAERRAEQQAAAAAAMAATPGRK